MFDCMFFQARPHKISSCPTCEKFFKELEKEEKREKAKRFIDSIANHKTTGQTES